MTKQRLEAFSDGVIAIAITLLALELPVPHGAHLDRQLAHAWPSYFAYFVSFTIIGIMWVNHHSLLAVLARIDRALMLLNLWLLAFIVLVPWTTELAAENLREPGGKLAVAVYSLTFVGCAIGFNAMWLWITRGPQLLPAHIDHRVLQQSRLRFGVGVVVYVATVGVAFVSPVGAMVLHALIALYYLVDQLGVREATQRQAG